MKEDELYIALGKQIKTLRENAHLTQEKLAEKAGISLDYLGKIEVNINKPGLKHLLKFLMRCLFRLRRFLISNRILMFCIIYNFLLSIKYFKFYN